MEELTALQGTEELREATTFSKRELLAIEYARHISKFPLSFTKEFILDKTSLFEVLGEVGSRLF